MAKIVIAGDAAVIISSRTMEDLKTLQKYNPRSLKLYETDENGKSVEVFAVAPAISTGSISNVGACFDGVSRDGSGKATLTILIPDGVEDASKYVADTIGVALARLNRVEAQFDQALETVANERRAVMDSISVVG